MKIIRNLMMVAASAATLASPAVGQELVLRGAAYLPLETTWGIPFKIFVDRVNETGKGVLQISAMGPEAIPATEQPNALRSGLIDFASMPPGTYKHVVPEGNAQDLSNLTLAEQRASGGYAALNEVTREKLNAELLTTYGTGVNFHLYLTREISSVEDLKGLRVRGQPIYSPFFKSLDLSSVSVPAPETYTALERGVVHGYGWTAWGIQDLGWDKLTKVRVEPGFYNSTMNILINKDRLAALTPEQRKVLDDAVVWFEAEMAVYMATQGDMHRAAQDAAGIKAVDLGEGFAKQAADVYWDELLRENPDTIPGLRALLQK